MIKDRVLQVLEIKKFKKEHFFTKIGVTSANFRGNAKKTPLNSNTIENILSEVPDLDVNWLLTGKGEMFKSDNTPIESKQNKPEIETGELILNQQRTIENLSEIIENLSVIIKNLTNKG